VQGQSGWRASLENPHTGERLGFSNLERLFAFLIDQTSIEIDSPLPSLQEEIRSLGEECPEQSSPDPALSASAIEDKE
jgi:hypothetical protein